MKHYTINVIEIITLSCVALNTEYSEGTCPNDHVRNYCLAKFGGEYDTIPPLGSTYIRWGRTTCPTNTGAEAVYSGRAAGASFSATGGGANILCLPDDPNYFTSGISSSVEGFTNLTGVEYHTHNTRSDILYQNAPCVVCYTPRATSLMIPAKTVCPTSWTLEYVGYIITTYWEQESMDYECLDKDLEFIPGESAKTFGVTLHFVEATCNTGIACPPYHAGKEVSCAVCTK